MTIHDDEYSSRSVLFFGRILFGSFAKRHELGHEHCRVCARCPSSRIVTKVCNVMLVFYKTSVSTKPMNATFSHEMRSANETSSMHTHTHTPRTGICSKTLVQARAKDIATATMIPRDRQRSLRTIPKNNAAPQDATPGAPPKRHESVCGTAPFVRMISVTVGSAIESSLALLDARTNRRRGCAAATTSDPPPGPTDERRIVSPPYRQPASAVATSLPKPRRQGHTPSHPSMDRSRASSFRPPRYGHPRPTGRQRRASKQKLAPRHQIGPMDNTPSRETIDPELLLDDGPARCAILSVQGRGSVVRERCRWASASNGLI
ncbi:hypothetical protein CCYA_CCYA17G4278 [Cyanidiococcus yangmingshanensis]|nr:hypothetical protein CCYA_CCYA17G4278 [Cyanidiococcus yangmingshanensis]